jgi:hypothetical protein
LVVTWAEFEQEAPELAECAKRLLGGDATTGFISTVARDGRPRIAPVSPIFTQDNLYLCVVAATPKRYDLVNDGRYVLHANLGAEDEEFQVSGRATVVTDVVERDLVHAAITFQFERTDPVFSLQVDRCFRGYWVTPGQPGTYPVKARWVAPA